MEQITNTPIILAVVVAMISLSIIWVGGILHAFKTRTLGSVSKKERARRERRVEKYTPTVEETAIECFCCCCNNRASSKGGA